MTSPLSSLIASGTKLWLDSVDPDLVQTNRALGATGATSNPIIISDLIKSGKFDAALGELAKGQSLKPDEAAWKLTDEAVEAAQKVFFPTWESTKGNDGYVSFELDPLLEDASCPLSVEEKAARYVELGKKWAAGHRNRMIKVPATPGGLAALERLCAAGITLNVTLIFSMRQYKAARDAVWRGAQQRASLEHFKSVYSIFVSRVDVYTEKFVPELSPAAQGLVGIVGAKRIWEENRKFWSDKRTPLQQEMIFASTGTKKSSDPPWKYVAALAGSDIQTNPPATNDAVEKSGMTFRRQVDELPDAELLAEIDAKVSQDKLEVELMREGVAKFADPFKSLLTLLTEKLQKLADTK